MTLAQPFSLVRGDQPTERQIELANPLDEEVVVELLEAPTGGFTLPPFVFPAVLRAGGVRPLIVTFTPGESTVETSSMRVLYEGPTKRMIVVIELQAEIDAADKVGRIWRLGLELNTLLGRGQVRWFSVQVQRLRGRRRFVLRVLGAQKIQVEH